MSREEDSPTPAEDPAPVQGDEEAADEAGHSGSRWEPPCDAPEPDEPTGERTAEYAAPTGSTATPVTGATWWQHDTAAAPSRPRRRALRVAVGVGAAVLLAGGGFAVGHAVSDSGPDGGPAGGPGLSRHHGDRDGGVGRHGRSGQAPAGQAPAGQGQTGQGQTGQAPIGEHTSGSSSPILGGLFT